MAEERKTFDIVLAEKLDESVSALPKEFNKTRFVQNSMALLNEHPEYQDLFNEFSAKGAYAWGISGSGSSAFALWRADDFSGFRSELPCAEDTFIFSQKGDAS